MPDNVTMPPVLADDLATPSVKTATFGDYRRIVGQPNGSRIVVASDGQSYCVVDAKGQPLVQSSVSVGAALALATALNGRKVIRVTL